MFLSVKQAGRQADASRAFGIITFDPRFGRFDISWTCKSCCAFYLGGFSKYRYLVHIPQLHVPQDDLVVEDSSSTFCSNPRSSILDKGVLWKLGVIVLKAECRRFQGFGVWRLEAASPCFVRDHSTASGAAKTPPLAANCKGPWGWVIHHTR